MKAIFLTFILTAQVAMAGDWPMWRYDSGRGASSPHALPKDLSLHWVRQLPPPMPAWPEEQDRLQFDEVAEPVVMGERIFVPSSRYDSVSAYSTRTGEELWRFYAEGPVRFAPVAHAGRVYFCSDDGCLYALKAEDGALVWKVNGAGRERLILGNHRLISSWPARGGVVLHEGKLFFGASIWPFMGIYIQAIDPDTGATIWSNSGDGTNYTIQPHGAPSFASVVPQGHFAAVGQQLIVPGGRSVPGIYDTETGSQKVFAFDKRNGSHLSGAVGGLFFSADKAYLLKDGNPVDADAPAIFDHEVMIAAENDALIEQTPAVDFKEEVKVDRKGAKYRQVTPRLRELSRTKLAKDIPGQWRLRAGDRFYAGGTGLVAAYEKGNGKPVWESEVEGEVRSMLAADGRLFVLTNAGLLHCYGPGKATVARHELEVKTLAPEPDEWTRKAAEILTNQELKHGYALAFGLGSGRLVEELLRHSELHIIVLEADAKKVEAYRRKMELAGFYGSRTSILAVDPMAAPLPAYLCRLIVSEDPTSAGLGKPEFAEHVFHSLRPYGGLACLALSEEQRAALAVQARALPGAEVKTSGAFTQLTREGALPNTDDWTHQYANAAQTVVSGDAQVKAPFGVLWFGGPSHEGVLPRHGHGPSPQVAGGRLFIEGADMLRAVDVYTGQLLWEKEMPDFGKYYNTTAHFAGAGEIGSNYVSMPDRVYAVYGSSLLEIDSVTGETLRDHQLPAEPGKDAPFWGHLSVSGDYLIATSSPVSVDLASVAPAPKNAADGLKEIIPPGAVWHYLAGQDPPDNWDDPDFEESADWKKGQAGFGYGDGDDATILDMQGKYTRVYIRSDFEGPPVDKVQRLALNVAYDDAFIAYLNGEEVLRAGIKEGRGAGVKSVSGHSASGFELMELKDWEKHLRPGRNVLAIEGHNTKITSSDFTLHPVLVMAAQTAVIPAKPASDGLPPARYGSGSQRLVVFDRQSGKLLWQRDAEFDFRHNNIAVAGDRIFCIDRLTQEREAILTRRGLKFEGKPALYALDLKTGGVLWEQHEGVFGTFLNYSVEHDVVLQASSVYRDRAKDEAKAGMMALRGRDGKVLWHNPDITYGGPCLLWHRQILTNGLGGFSIDLLTGEKSGWTYDRKYGCNTAVGSEHLLTFRSGAAGFFDLNADSGTGNLGGFRSSCTNNLIPANGVLNAPDYTRTCTCSYQNQTSLALVHMPQEEYWTYGAKAKPGRIGINFGAPGDRRSEDGTLFVEYPSVGGTSDEAEVEVEGKSVSYRRRHSSTMTDPAHAWIGASVVESPSEITVELPDEAAKDLACKVRLYFAEPDELKVGERVFDVSLQGKPVLTGLDLAAEGARRQTLIREFEAKAAGRKVTLTFQSKGGRGAVLSGLEVLYPASNAQTAFRP